MRSDDVLHCGSSGASTTRADYDPNHRISGGGRSPLLDGRHPGDLLKGRRTSSNERPCVRRSMQQLRYYQHILMFPLILGFRDVFFFSNPRRRVKKKRTMTRKCPRFLRYAIPSKGGRREERKEGEVRGGEGQGEVNRWVSEIHRLKGTNREKQHHSRSTAKLKNVTLGSAQRTIHLRTSQNLEIQPGRL